MTYDKIATYNRDFYAIKDSRGHSITYGELADNYINFKTLYKLQERDFVILLCENSVEAATFFLSSLHNNVVTLLLNAAIEKEMLENYLSVYTPNYIYAPINNKVQGDWNVVSTQNGYTLLSADLSVNKKPNNKLYSELSFLLPTSGSTGSPKLVRHSYKNIYANAENVAASFNLNSEVRAMLALPIYFTQGLSVLCSHIHAGACVYLTNDALSSREFWTAMKEEKITSFTGVPYSYEIMDKLRFYRMNLPDLTVISQGGGRLSDNLWNSLAEYANTTRRKFYATYGASETTARMSLLPPELAKSKICSIGKPIGNYKMWLDNGNGTSIERPHETGELIFEGDNVTLGYAESLSDLLKGDERNGVYKTDDMAYRDEDGFYYITGRQSRFVKVFGLRISLDEVERMVKNRFGNDNVCAGNDSHIYIFTANKNADSKSIIDYLKDKLRINISAFKVKHIEEIPKNQYGKTNYAMINKLIQQEESHE